MPTYDYECEKCGHHFEKFQSMSDPVLKTCPKCKGKVKRLIGTGAGLHFKGEGFYITENRSKGYQEKAKSDKAAEGGSSGSSGGDASGGAKEATGGTTGPADKASGTTSKPEKSSGEGKAKSPSASKKTRSGGSGKSSN